MTVAAAKVSSNDTNDEVTAKASASEFVGVALFSGIGLLLSLAVVILDQFTLGEWF